MNSKKNSNYLVLLIFTFIVLMLPIFIKNIYQLKLVTFVGINAIIAIGLCLLFGYAGQISIGHAAFYGLGAYASAILTTTYGYSVWLSMFLALVLTAFIAWIIGIPTLRLKGHYLAMATLGFGEITYLLFIQLEGLTGGFNGFSNIPSPKLFGIDFNSGINYYYLVWVVAIILLLFSINLLGSKIGRALRALHGSEVAAEAVGINTSKYKISVFVLSAIYGSIGGSLYAHFVNYLYPTSFSLHFSLFLVIVVVLGGMTNIWGAITGSFILTLLPEYLREFKEYNLLIYSLILIMVMLFMPEGLVPGIGKAIKNFRKGS